jgi:hypothetical protein
MKRRDMAVSSAMKFVDCQLADRERERAYSEVYEKKARGQPSPGQALAFGISARIGK